MLNKILCILYEENKICEAQKLQANLCSGSIELEIIFAKEVSGDCLSIKLKEEEELLCITDHGETARSILERQIPVLAYLHQDNKEEDFTGISYAVESIGEVEYSYLAQIYCRVKGLPFLLLETERCQLRETILGDIPAFYQIYKEPSITYYMENLYDDPEEEKAYIKEYIKTVYGFYGYGMWTVVLKENGQVIGRAGLDWRAGFSIPELGFVIAVPYQGQGLGYEVCQAILAFGKKELSFNSVQALVKKQNNASVRLCERLGFVLKEQVLSKGVEYERYVLEDM